MLAVWFMSVTDDSAGVHGADTNRLAQNRRRRPRLAMRWHVSLWRGAAYAADAETTNVCSDGFYGISPGSFSQGEKLTAVLELPDCGGEDVRASLLALRCEVEVLRVEPIITAVGCGIACRILDYTVLNPRCPS